MSRLLWRTAGLMGGLIWIAMMAFWIHDAFARTAFHSPIYFAPVSAEANKKPKRVVKRFKNKTTGRCKLNGQWIRGCQ